MKLFLKVTCLSILVTVCFSCGKTEEKKAEVVRPVKYQKVVPGGGIQTRSFTGTSVSGTETRLSFKVGGTVNSLRVKIGEEVSKNTLLATLDDSDYELQYEQADAAVKNADASEEQAKANFERVRSLYENGSTSLSNFESAKASYESAKANESSLKKSRKLAKAQLEYTRLYSPIRGKISSVDAEVNENVAAGQQVLVLSSEGDLEVNLGVPESFISSINVQDVVSITFSAAPGQTFRGVVSEVGFNINSQTSTYPVVIKLDDPENQVRPGMAASVTFEKRQDHPEELLLVPAQAVGEDENGNFVYTLIAEDEFYLVKRQAVTVGTLTGEGFQITDGLVEGDLIATAGLQMLLEGMKVRLFEN